MRQIEYGLVRHVVLISLDDRGDRDRNDLDRTICVVDQKEQISMNDTSRAELLARINELEEFITSQPGEITEFDENLARKLLAKVTVYEEKLVFEFKSGVSVEIE